MASTSFSSQIVDTVRVDIKLSDALYSNVKLSIMNDLCVNVILGLDFQSLHQSITLSLGGSKPPLIVCLAALDVPPSWACGVVVSMFDFHCSDWGSNPGRGCEFS